MNETLAYGELRTYCLLVTKERKRNTRGDVLTIIFVLVLMVSSNWSKSMVHLAAEEVLDAPSFGGCIGTYRMVPPGISILLMYLCASSARALTYQVRDTDWSKKGSKMITSSPGSMNAMKAQSIPRAPLTRPKCESR
jgi:hypothetical protein